MGASLVSKQLAQQKQSSLNEVGRMNHQFDRLDLDYVNEGSEDQRPAKAKLVRIGHLL